MAENNELETTYEVPARCTDAECNKSLRLRDYGFDPEPSTDVENGRPDHIEPAGPVAEADCLLHGIVWSTRDPNFNLDDVVRTS